MNIAEYPARPLRRKKPAILFFRESDELRLMNYAALKDETTRAFIGHCVARGWIRREERGCGMARHMACIVRDERAVRESALLNDIRVL